MKRFFYIFYSLLFIIVFSCSKKTILEEELEVEPTLFSCVTYDTLLDPLTTKDDDLMQYWDKFVADVLCTKGAPDYGQQNTVVNLFFEYESDAMIAAGVTQDHIAYSSFDGYCNSAKVNVGVDWRSWTERSLLQRLWIMYHEFGHDVYRYEHSPDPADIMYYASTPGFIKINDFIQAKDRFIKRDFPGISYINCPPDTDGSIEGEYEDFHICSLNPPDIF
tara:strand:+ start:62 stop:721 length:660 start_codon:yes stop_codon:yes gene_type:complete